MTAKRFNQLVKQHSDRLFGYAFKLCQEKEWAKDLVQNSFMKLWENREKIDDSHVRPFLFRVLYNKMIDDRRKAKKIEYKNALLDTRVQVAYKMEHQDLINHAFNALNEKQKNIILLRDWEGYSYDEIAENMGFSLAQVKINLFRARKKMKQVLQDLESEITDWKYGY